MKEFLTGSMIEERAVYRMDVMDFIEECRESNYQVDAVITDPPYNIAKNDAIVRKEWADIRLDFGCYDDQTEILTLNGWKLFKELNNDDLVASLNRNRNTMYWTKPSKIQIYDYKGKMLETKSKSLDFCVTLNHRLYTRIKHRKYYEFVEAGKLGKNQYQFKNFVKWDGKEEEWFYLPKVEGTSNRQNSITRIKMDDWLEFLGWYIAEGYSLKSGNARFVMISQKKNEYLDEIKDCIDRCGFHWTYSTSDYKFKICHKQLWTYMKKIGSSAINKKIPAEFLNLSTRQLKILCKSLLKGDGNEWGGYIHYYTSSRILADQVQEIGIKIGYNPSIREKNHPNPKASIHYDVYFKKTMESSMRRENLDEIDYDGKIYCCTVPSHVILVRRNGKALWCGNSWDKFDDLNSFLGWTFTWIESIDRLLRPGGIFISFFDRDKINYISRYASVKLNYFLKDYFSWVKPNAAVQYRKKKMIVGWEEAIIMQKPSGFNEKTGNWEYNNLSFNTGLRQHLDWFEQKPEDDPRDDITGEGLWFKNSIIQGLERKEAIIIKKHQVPRKKTDDQKTLDGTAATKTVIEKVRHPNQKPLNVMEVLITYWTRPGELVIDPFAGVGSTLVACELSGRRWLGNENDETWAMIANRRLRKYMKKSDGTVGLDAFMNQ